MIFTHEYNALTTSEKYLTHLCKNTFLNLWSWPHIYRNQRWNGGDGKEVCDLLVVFENNIIIFSDKYCEFPDTGDLTVDWCRWFNKAILKSANQVWGAERWIRQYPNNLFIDKDCRKPFPYPLPNMANANFHRIVVAHGSAMRCSKELGGNGSLMINPSIIGEDHYNLKSGKVTPFTIGRLSENKGFVHVLDDFNLDIVLQTVDTITDFTSYLEKKQIFFESGKLGGASGEEDLLGAYFSKLNSKGEHDFKYPSKADLIILEEGFWGIFQTHPNRLSQLEADRVSYVWDNLIDKFSVNILGGTLYNPSHTKISDHEIGLRILAREPRTRRRMLARSLIQVLERAEHEIRSARVVAGVDSGEPYYIFLSLDNKNYSTIDKYRNVRRNLLESYCLAAKVKFPNAEQIIGIATEPISHKNRSEDLIYIDARHWTKNDQEEAENIRDEFNLLVNTKMFQKIENEFPREELENFKKGRNRNRPCHCGSGKKFKKCCGK
jgi:hypothetical protein